MRDTGQPEKLRQGPRRRGDGEERAGKGVPDLEYGGAGGESVGRRSRLWRRRLNTEVPCSTEGTTDPPSIGAQLTVTAVVITNSH